MKKIKITFIVCIVSFFSISQSLYAQSEQEQRIRASYILAFGKDASGGEVSYWKTQGNLSISQLITRHQQYFRQDANTRRTTIIRAYQDAMGRNPSEGEIAYWKNGVDTYTTLMNNHIQWLQGNPAEYENSIKRSYSYALNKVPTSAEINYWRNQGTISYLVLVACHKDYQRRTLSSSPINFNASAGVEVKLSSAAIAKEAFQAVGGRLIGNDSAGLIGNDSGGIIAAGAGKMVAAGGGNMVAAGGGNMVAAGGGN